MKKPVCTIVGVGPGNGAAFARRFTEAGYAIALLARSTAYTNELAAELDDARAYECDASDPDSVVDAFSRVRDDMGDTQILIYNAGGGSWQTVEEVSVEDFERGWRVNALGALVAAQQVLPAMQSKGEGNIVFVGATASLRGGPKAAGFASAKAAQRSLAQSMARHLGPRGIHVSLMIIDGIIRSERRPGSEGERLEAKDIASLAHYLTTQPSSCWSFEVDARPFKEKW